MKYIKSCLIITMLLGIGYSQECEIAIYGGEYGTLYVLYDTDEPIAGFQFEITGENDIDIINVYGGEAGDAGFMLVTGDNSVLGLSLDGSVLTEYGVLVNIDFEGSGMLGQIKK